MSLKVIFILLIALLIGIPLLLFVFKLL